MNVIKLIVFQNEHFIVVNKPANTLSVPPRFPGVDKRVVLGLELQKQLKIDIYPTHRLDFEVSGLILYAKTKQAHADANHWFEHKTIRKMYEAKTLNTEESFPFNELLIWKSKLVKGKKRTFEADHGKDSVTEAYLLRVEESDGQKLRVWNLFPITGRSHQLRFELYKRGMPIIGDSLYGSTIIKNDGIELKARKIIFPENALMKYGLPAYIEI